MFFSGLVVRPVLLASLVWGGSACADVSYSFDSAFGAFKLVIKQPLTKGAVFPAQRLLSSKGFLDHKVTAVEFNPGIFGNDVLTIHQGQRSFPFNFRSKAFTGYGSNKTRAGLIGNLRVERIKPTAPPKRQPGIRP